MARQMSDEARMALASLTEDIELRLQELENAKQELEAEVRAEIAADLQQPNDITPTEACIRYGQLHRLALEHATHQIVHGRYPKDSDNHLAEALFQICLGENIFSILNQMER